MNTGGPAFPQHGWSKDPQVLERMRNQGGMTLLDWFAGQALAGLVSESGRYDAAGAALDAYDLASAMLAEKARRESDHSGDANKMVELEARNRELVQALSAMEMWVPTHCENQAVAAARAVLEKAKEAKP